MNSAEADLKLERMIQTQLINRNIQDSKVINAFRKVKRHLFVRKEYIENAYDDSPLPIGFGQTISQPYMVAKITEVAKLQDSDILLEIGAGSGYQAAIAAQLCKKVYAVEVIKELAEFAKSNLKKAGINNVEVINKSGFHGYPEHAPYDRIIFSAAAEQISEKLFKQLKENGTMVAPVGTYPQTLFRFTKKNGQIIKERFLNCVFVPLVR
jgi:protein-L-isoaspartate(D-aspartate) O-methyltransferase